MLKITRLSDKLVSNRNDGSKSAFNKNNNSKPVSKRNINDGEINRFNISRNGMEYAKKLGKLFKSRKSKSKKMFKFQNLAKSRKKLSKSENLIKFNITEVRPKFLTPNAKIIFDYL